ncbi:hypothetical protein M0R04_06475 [Candidatus Dojkabacteria bacterium]|jgi:DnaJ-class molecular chaperone|nr:hypothetical protein [Candidatus Dojkabacteria bacterium]
MFDKTIHEAPIPVLKPGEAMPCPKCKGTGKNQEYRQYPMSLKCDVCDGKKFIKFPENEKL